MSEISLVEQYNDYYVWMDIDHSGKWCYNHVTLEVVFLVGVGPKVNPRGVVEFYEIF